MAEPTQATPRSWVPQQPDMEKDEWYIDTHAYESGPEPVVHHSYPLSGADAHLIVLAVNHHEPLLEALRALLSHRYKHVPLTCTCMDHEQARAAIAAAEGGGT